MASPKKEVISSNKIKEAVVVGWLCPICFNVISPYQDMCPNPACKPKTAEIILSYFKEK